ncbi:MAG: amidohydrolase family protein [Roseivirga sp.]|nr:amidohydrolase family protein [Roseivirga sp.]
MHFFSRIILLLVSDFRYTSRAFLTLLIFIVLSGPALAQKKQSFEELYGEDAQCYNRKREGYWSKVDSHNHFRPFGGNVIPFAELMTYFNKSGVHFINAYGIGQTLPSNGDCAYYLDCPGTAVTPSLRNDFVNAANYLEYQGPNSIKKIKDPFEGEDKLNLVLSMTFPDLANPERITEYIALLDREYPEQFKWMGEVNLVKQALFPNMQYGANLENIKDWAPFMEILRNRDMPINIHSDIGNDTTNMTTKYLYLMEDVLERYTDNKIVWSHMGLSKELTKIGADEHIDILKRLLGKHPNLTLDLSWDVLWNNVFKYKDKRDKYLTFINAYPTRFITGTDFVASRKGKKYETYEEAVEVTSRINCEMSDEAFRNIALGQNYFDLLGLPFTAPDICEFQGKRRCKYKD